MDTMAAYEYDRVRRPHPPDRPYPIGSKYVPRANDEIITSPLVKARLLRCPQRNVVENTETVTMLPSMDQVVNVSKKLYQAISGHSYLQLEYKKLYYSTEDELNCNIFRTKDILLSCHDVIDRLVRSYKIGISDEYNVATDPISSLREWMDTMKTRSDMRERHNLNLTLDLNDKEREVGERNARIRSLEDELKRLEFEKTTLLKDKEELLLELEKSKEDLRNADEKISMLSVEKIHNPCSDERETHHDRNELSVTELYGRCVELELENEMLNNSLQKLKSNLSGTNRSSTPFPHTSKLQKPESDAVRILQVQLKKSLIENEKLEKNIATLKNTIPCQITPGQEGRATSAKIKKLEHSKCQLEKQNAQLKRRLDEIERENNYLERELEDSRDQINLLHDEKAIQLARLKDVQQLLKQKEQILGKKAAYTEDCDNLPKRLDNATNENRHLREKLAENAAKFAQEIEKLRRSLDDAKRDNKLLRETLKDAKTNSDQLGKDVDRLRNKLDETNGKSNHLDILLNDTKEKNKQLEHEKENLLTRLNQVQELLKQQESMLVSQGADTANSDFLSKRNENANLRNKLEEERAQSVQLGQEIEELRNRLDAAKTESANLRKRLEYERARSAQLKQEKEELNNRLDAAKNESANLEKKLEYERARSVQLEQEKEELNHRLDYGKSEKINLNEKHLEISAKADLIDKENENLQHRLDGAESEKKRLREKLKEANSTSIQLGKEIEGLQNRLDESNRTSHRLETLLNDSNDKIKRLEQENADLVTRLDENERQICRLDSQLQASKDNIEQLNLEKSELLTRLNDSEKERQSLAQELKQQNATSGQLVKEKVALNNRLKEVQGLLEQQELMLAEHGAENCDILAKRLDDAKSENTNLRENLEEERAKTNHVEQEIEKLRSRLENGRKENTTLSEKSQEASAKADLLGKDKERLQSSLDDAVKDNKRVSEKLREANAMSAQLGKEVQRLQNSLDETDRKRHRLEGILNNSKDKIKQLEQEKDDLLTRLSQYTSAQLVQDNPNVADLSDLNRPTKLAEKLSELYDNDWTDAFEVLMEKFGFSEEQAIKHLFDIVQMTYSFCSDTAEQQVDMLKRALNGLIADHSPMSSSLKLDAVQLRTIHDLRKQTSQQSMESVKKGIIQHMKNTNLASPDPARIISYVEKCTELCWYMMLPSPPLYVSPPETPGDSFDKNKYRYYQTSGTRYKFFVWPTLYLYKDGNMLAKGIAEGM